MIQHNNLTTEDSVVLIMHAAEYAASCILLTGLVLVYLIYVCCPSLVFVTGYSIVVITDLYHLTLLYVCMLGSKTKW